MRMSISGPVEMLELATKKEVTSENTTTGPEPSSSTACSNEPGISMRRGTKSQALNEPLALEVDSR